MKPIAAHKPPPEGFSSLRRKVPKFGWPIKLALVIGIPLVIVAIGALSDSYGLTGNVTTPLVKDAVDFYVLAAVVWLVLWLLKRKGGK